jgi:3-isopropylmalate/(R)-2-methylmalate dehydratase small subunit
VSAPRALKQVTGRALPLPGSDIDTDRIIPARFMKAVTFEGLGEHAFHDARFHEDGSPKDHPFNDARYRGAAILVVGANFGCGSSREHAPQALMRWGIRAVVGLSFAEIFAGNCLAIGLPTVTVAPRDAETLMRSVTERPETQITVDLEALRLSYGEREMAVSVPEGARRRLIEGTWDGTALLLANREHIETVASRLPYLRDFR